MSNNNENQVQTSAALGVASVENRQFQQLDGEYGTLLPPGYTVEFFDELKSQPRRIKCNQKFSTVESFVEYLNNFKIDDMSIVTGNCRNVYKNQGGELFTAVIDYHSDSFNPAWCNHSVSLEAITDKDWILWHENEKVRMTQRDFIHFIEDNAQSIAAPDIAGIIEKVRKVTVTNNQKLSHKVDDESESTQAEGSVVLNSGVPETMSLALRPFLFSDKYSVSARIFVHTGEARPYISYQLVKSDKVSEAVFNEWADKIAKDTGLEVYI